MKLFAVSYATAIYALFFNVQPVLIGLLHNEFGFGESQLGAVLGVAFLVAAVTIGSSYFWVDRFRRLAAIRLGIVIAVAGLVVLLFATNYLSVTLGMTLLSFGLAITAAPVLIILGHFPNPTRAFGYGITAMVVLAAICVFLIPAVLYPHWGYQGVIGFLMALVATTLVLVPWIPEPTIRNDQSNSSSSSASALAWLALLAIAIYFAGLNSNWAFFELLGERLQLTSKAIGGSLSVALLAGAIGSIAAAKIEQRLSISVVMGIAIVGFCFYIVIAVSAASPLAFAAAATLFNIVWNFSLPYTMELVRSHDNTGRLLGQVPTAQMVGGAAGPLAGGLLLTISGPAAIYLLLMGCVVIATALFAWLDRQLHRSRVIAGVK